MKAGRYRTLKALSLFVLIALTFKLSIPVFAESSLPDRERKGSILINLEDYYGKPITEDTEITIYKIAEIVTQDYNLVYDFEDTLPITHTTLQQDGVSLAADRLAGYIEKTKPSLERIIGKPNNRMKNLAHGMYLVIQTKPMKGYDAFKPMMLSVPYTDPDGDQWIYDVTATPKVSALPTPTPVPVIPDVPDEKVDVPIIGGFFSSWVYPTLGIAGGGSILIGLLLFKRQRREAKAEEEQ